MKMDIIGQKLIKVVTVVLQQESTLVQVLLVFFMVKETLKKLLKLLLYVDGTQITQHQLGADYLALCMEVKK